MADQPVILNYDLEPSAQLQSKLQRQMADLEKGLRLKGPFGPAIRDVRDFGSELDRANQRVITLGASFAVLATSIRTLKDIARSTIEVEKAFKEINAVFQLGTSNLDRFSKDLFNTARETSQSFEKAAQAAKEFSRQGLSAGETIKRTRDALILTRLASLDVASSVETLTASLNGFQKSALTSTAIVNKLATVDAQFAVSSKDLAEGLARAGAAASDAGVSFDELIGLITAAQQTTARGGAVIGNAFKTIFTRVERRDTIDAMEALGVAVRDAEGNVLSALPLLQNFSKTYDQLGATAKKSAAELVGGVYQINILKAVLGDLAKAHGIAADATRTSTNATDEALRRNEALNKSLDATLERLGATAKQVGANIGSQSFAGPLKTVLNTVLNNPLTEALQDASGQAETAGGKWAEFFLKGIGGALVYGLGPLIGAAIGKVSFRSVKGVVGDFKDITGLNTKSQEQARIQSEIVSLYRAGGAALQTQLSLMSSMAEKAALVSRLISAGAANPNSVQAMTSAVMGLRRGTPRAAGGYVPIAEESAAISAGVGGAPASARPVFLPSFNRGGGQRGIVANTSEFIVPGAAGGAIFNRDMIRKYGLPPGATPVAAGGYIPNAAGGVDGPLPGWAASNIDDIWREAQRLGVVDKIAAMAAQRLNAQQTAAQLNLPKGGLQGMDSKTMVRVVRNKLGIPSMDQTTEFEAWLKTVGFGGGGAAPPRPPVSAPSAAPLGPDPSSSRFGSQGLQSAITQQYSRADMLRTSGGRFLANTQLQELNKLFDTVVKAGSGPEARLLGKSVIDFSQGMNELSRSRVMEDLGRQFALFDKGLSLAGVRARLVTDQSRRAGGPGSIIESRPSAGGRYRVEPYGMQSLVAAGLLPPPETYGPPAPPPILPLGMRQPGFFARGLNRLRNANPTALGLTAAFALPFAGGVIPEGRGGTLSGVGLGAAGSGLTGAGFGASSGLIFGPAGAGIGALIGGVGGGIVGALRKINKSFEEVAAEITESTARINEQLGRANEFFRLDADITNARQNGTPSAQVVELVRQQRASLAGVSDPKVRALLAANDQDGARLYYQNQLAATKVGDDLRSSVVGGLQQGAPFGVFRFSGPTKQSTERISQGVTPALANLTPIQLKALESLNRNDPQAAIRSLGKVSGLGAEGLGDVSQQGATLSLLSKIPGYGSLFRPLLRNSSATLGAGIGQALGTAREVQEEEARREKAKRTTKEFTENLRELASQMELSSQLTIAFAQSAEQLNRAQQDRALADPRLTDIERLTQSGRFEASNLAANAESRRQAELLSGRGRLFGMLEQMRVNDPAVRDRVAGLSSKQEVEQLLVDLDTQQGRESLRGLGTKEVKQALEELARNLSLLEFTTEEQIRVSKEINQVQREQLRFFKTLPGARQQYGGAARNAGIGVVDALNRNDTPDLLLQRIVEANRANLDDDFNAGRIDSRTFQGRRLGIGLNVNAAERINGDRAVRALLADQSLLGAKDLTGAQVESGLFGGAQQAGIEGKAGKSFLGGFRSVIEGAKRDLLDFSEAGARVAASLNSSFTDFWTDWSTGAAKGKDAFKGFVASVLTDASRMLASKAFTAAISAIPGFGAPAGATGGEFTGAAFKFARGGQVPAMLTGGEYVIGPRAAKRIGYDTLRRLNGYSFGGAVHLADGGMVRGGSGVKDDVPARLPTGSFVIRKSAVNRLGGGYLDALAAGKVQNRWLGGALLGAALGGGLGYLSGGTRGAIGGALVGGIAGGLYSANSGGVRMDPGTGGRAAMGTGAKLALGAGLSAGLGLLAGGIMEPNEEPGPIGLDQVPAFRRQLEADQFNGRKPGQQVFLQINPQGGYSLAGFDQAPATRRWASGGGVDVPLEIPRRWSDGGSVDMPLAAVGGSAPSSSPVQQVSVKIEINNNGQVSSSTTANGDGPFGADMASKIDRQVRGIVQDELVRQNRDDGFFAQRSRYTNR